MVPSRAGHRAVSAHAGRCTDQLGQRVWNRRRRARRADPGRYGDADRNSGPEDGERGRGRRLSVSESFTRQVRADRDDAGLCIGHARGRARLGWTEYASRRLPEARDGAGRRHGHERDSVRRRGQGRDGPGLLGRAADADPDRARRLVAHPADSGRPARYGERRRECERERRPVRL